MTEKDKKVDNSQEDEITVQRIIIALDRHTKRADRTTRAMIYWGRKDKNNGISPGLGGRWYQFVECSSALLFYER